MGAGHYSFSNTRRFATSDYHIDQSANSESYEDLCDRVVAEVKKILLENPGAIAKLDANLNDADIEECVDIGWIKDLDDPMDDPDSPLSSIDSLRDAYYSEESYYEESQRFRKEDFEQVMGSRLSGVSSMPQLQEFVRESEEAKHGDYQVIAKGVFAAVGLKYWQESIYVGVLPDAEILNYEHLINGEVFDPDTGKDVGVLGFAEMQKLFARAALCIEQESKFEVGGYDRRADLQRIAGTATSGGIREDVLFGPNVAGYQRFPEGVGEALIARAQDAVEDGEEDEFEEYYGVSASDVITLRDALEYLGELMENTGHLPQAIEEGYKAEFDKLDVIVKAALNEVAPKDVNERTSAWTSQVVPAPTQQELDAALGKKGMTPDEVKMLFSTTPRKERIEILDHGIVTDERQLLEIANSLGKNDVGTLVDDGQLVMTAALVKRNDGGELTDVWVSFSDSPTHEKAVYEPAMVQGIKREPEVERDNGLSR